jgi:alkylated DNA nucleotide flippase Atl1
MAKTKKTWQLKLADAKAKEGLPKKCVCEQSGKWMVVPSPAEVEELMAAVPAGQILTMKQVSETLAKKHEVDFCCPMTSGIFAWIVAHATFEGETDTGVAGLPWWRTVKTGGELNPKFPGAPEIQKTRLESEGHKVVQKGKKLVVLAGK